DELSHAGLALAGTDASVKIFAGDDVGRGHRPVFGSLDVLLLEDHGALGIGDLSSAEFPFDFVVGGNAGLGEEAAEGKARGVLLMGGGWGFCFFDLFAYFGLVRLLVYVMVELTCSCF